MIIDVGKVVKPMPLLEALTAAGLPVLEVHPDGRVVLADDVPFDQAAFDAVIDAHDALILDNQEALELQRRRDAAQILRAHYARASSTNAQNTEAIKAQSFLMREVVQELREAE